MRPRLRFVAWLAGLGLLLGALLGLAGAALWLDLDAAERAALLALPEGRGALLVVLGGLLLVPFAVLLRIGLAGYPEAAARLVEEVDIIRRVNSGHRLKPVGARPMRRLARALNAFAEAHGALQQEVKQRIDEANAHLEQEKNRLAALMSELAQSVLVCNREGRILLYNSSASLLLEPGAAEAVGTPVGLGRSIFAILDQRLIVHALERLRQRLAQHSPRPVANFVTARGAHLLRAQMVPLQDALGELIGFVLILEDITRSVELNSRRDALLLQLTEGSRAALGNIRAAAETVQQYPQMDAEQRQRFGAVILDEAQRLSQQLQQTLARHADILRPQWPLEDMLASDLLLALQRNFATVLGVTAHYGGDDRPLWLSLDSYSLVQAMTQLMGALANACGVREVELELAGEGGFARLGLRWNGAGLEPEVLHEWEERPFSLGGDDPGASTLREVLERHGGELWCQTDHAAGVGRLCLQLPIIEPQPQPAQSSPAHGRPVYYDFDLFSQPGQTPELDERPLSELAYTVFDTETTGLAPSEGDEIISIGAVRMVNGRLLKQECFEQLIDPHRSIPRESQQVHGLTPELLAGQPGIAQVLPLFQRFAEDTVLVAHNAAFDMRFLQLKEEQTGVRFIQPVLDTLLLSALVHPGHNPDEHRLEQIAARLGVQVIGRHTALGDAMVTGEVFLRLLPLLAERGIHTLRQAREASQKTFYAKLEY
ncbi:PAS domain-containing protein [Pseudomonas sp. LPB0260]|uniref:3'-5' exonuclease n=1 Tax=Pseudomonas sp. LPB0260 TaxID=2614442 RepID=UPI0015C24636|nr:exonuclease domain-containing protein [Pseudomonas sp. LPB0260]QLC73792.1 PAS domain-containing protein [Pseudomonas sp. LPB0260]QLC76566.1 PAS domain-containing protein [Pseudomonas sp. LPB0260]